MAEPEKHVAVPQLCEDEVEPLFAVQQSPDIGVGEGAFGLGYLGDEEHVVVDECGRHLAKHRERDVVEKDPLKVLKADVRVVSYDAGLREAVDHGHVVASGGQGEKKGLEHVEVALGHGGEHGKDPAGCCGVREDHEGEGQEHGAERKCHRRSRGETTAYSTAASRSLRRFPRPRYSAGTTALSVRQYEYTTELGQVCDC